MKIANTVQVGPKMKRSGLPGLQEFLAIAQSGGLSAASRDSGVPKATLARQVKELEAALQTRLLERDGRQLRLSDEGQILFKRAAPLMSELDLLRNEIMGRSAVPSGRLKISVPALFAREKLGSVLATLVTRYPEITVDVDVNDGFVDPVRDAYDLVVRVNPSPDSDLVGRRFLSTDMVLAAPPDMTVPKQNGASVKAVVLKAQAGLGAWTVTSAGQELMVIPAPVVICSSMMVVLQTTRAGAGVALLPRALIMEDIAEGKLRLWGTVPNRQIEAWVLHTSTRLASPKLKVCMDLLVGAFQEVVP